MLFLYVVNSRAKNFFIIQLEKTNTLSYKTNNARLIKNFTSDLIANMYNKLQKKNKRVEQDMSEIDKIIFF